MSAIVPAEEIMRLVGIPEPRAARNLLDEEAQETLSRVEETLRDMIVDIALHIAECEDPGSERYSILSTRMVVLLREYYKLSGLDTAEKDMTEVKKSMVAVKTFMEKKRQEREFHKEQDKNQRDAIGEAHNTEDEMSGLDALDDDGFNLDLE